MKTENLSTLKIHKLSQEQYDREYDAGKLDPNAIYLTPCSEQGLRDVVLTVNGVEPDETGNVKVNDNFIVTISGDRETEDLFTADKSIDEIYAAYQNKQDIVCFVNDSGLLMKYQIVHASNEIVLFHLRLVNNDMFVIYTSDGIELQQSACIMTVNGVGPDENGNVEITIPEAGGNVDLTGVVKSVNGVTPDENGSVIIPTGCATASGWSTEEILLLEAILKNCVTQSDQTNNINALVTMLKANSSGSEGSGGSGGDSGSDETVTYTVTLNLTNVIPSNMVTSAKSGSIYVNQLSVDDGRALGTVTVTMGGYDVTRQYYDGNGTITIANVQGDIIISCKALAVETLNFARISAMPDKTTYEYTESSSGNYVAAKSTTADGTLTIAWDDSLATTDAKSPGFGIGLFKDNVPYMNVVYASEGSADIAFSDNVVTTNYGGVPKWGEPGKAWRGISASSSPIVVEIPDGCTCLVTASRGSFTTDTVTSNGTFGAWAVNGITATITEGE